MALRFSSKIMTNYVRWQMSTVMMRNGQNVQRLGVRSFTKSSWVQGFEEFFDPPMDKNEAFVAGREWSAADLRRKVC